MNSSLNKALLYVAGFICLAGCEQQSNLDITQYPASQSATAQAYLHYCSECHVPPQPAQYSFSAWSPVLERMQQRRRSRGMAPIPATDMTLILDYLQQYATK